MSMVTEMLKAKAEVYYGDQVSREKFSSLLSEIGLPDGLLTMQDIEECGYVKEKGFVLAQAREEEGARTGLITYLCVMTHWSLTAYVEPNKIKNLTVVKAKDFLVWFTMTEIHVKGPPQGLVITFKSLVGLSMSFPVSLFKAMKEAQVAKEEKWCRMIKL